MGLNSPKTVSCTFVYINFFFQTLFTAIAVKLGKKRNGYNRKNILRESVSTANWQGKEHHQAQLCALSSIKKMNLLYEFKKLVDHDSNLLQLEHKQLSANLRRNTK